MKITKIQMKPKVNIIIVYGDRWTTEFMQSADLFEHSKVIGFIKEMAVEYEKGTKVDFERASKIIVPLKNALEKTNQIVSFIHILSIETEDAILKNNNKIKPYINKDIRIVSDGKQCFFLYKFVESFGIKVYIDEQYFFKKDQSYKKELLIETTLSKRLRMKKNRRGNKHVL